MAILLSIETATRVCSVAVHRDSSLVGVQTYHLEKSHSSLLPKIVGELLTNCELTLADLDAICVSAGPGSYTGLRIGVTCAKGLAFAQSKPLIAVSTLATMQRQVRNVIQEDAYFCPMIDARRMEVYCDFYEGNDVRWPSTPLIVEADSFAEFTDKTIYLFGDGAAKTREVLDQKNIRWIPDIHPSAVEIGTLALEKFERKDFEDVAYFEPIYLKEFHTKPAKKLI